MNILCFGQQRWDLCWTEKQEYSTRLAARGHRVLFVNPGMQRPAAGGSLGRRARALFAGLGPWDVREVQPRVFVYSYHVVPALRGRWNLRRHLHSLATVARRLDFQAPVALAMLPLDHTRQLIHAVNPAACIYYPVDQWSALVGPDPWEARRVAAEEEALLGETDLALAIAPRLLERIREIQPRSYLLPNGVDPDYFAPARLARTVGHPQLCPLPHPRIGFLGQIDERMDQDLILAMARSHPEWQIVFAGRVARTDASRLQGVPNIHFLGFQPYEALPSVLRELDVGLIPYRLIERTQFCWPQKAYEYLAAGLPVVSTPVPALLSLQGTIAVAETPESFRQAVEAAVADPERGRSQRLAVAAENSWDERTDRLEAYLDEALAAAARERPAPPLVPSPARRLPGPRGDYTFLHRVDVLESRFPRKKHLLQRASVLAGRAYHGLRVAARLLRGQRPVRIRKILVARKGFLGDTIVFLPMLEALRKLYPHAKITLGVQPGFAAHLLLRNSPDIDAIRVLEPQILERAEPILPTLRKWLPLFLAGYDLVLSGSMHTMLPDGFFCGAPYRVGLDDGHLLQAYNNRLVPYDTTRHEAENNLQMVNLLRGTIHRQLNPPRLDRAIPPVSAGEQAAFGLPEGVPVLTVHAGSKRPSRRWAPERFAQVVGRLLGERPELRVVFTGTPEERELVESIVAQIPESLRDRTTSSVGITDLAGLVGLVDRSQVVLSNDTGTVHLARARNIPVVALFGPGNPRQWGPFPLGGAPAVVLHHEVPCTPCKQFECPAMYCLRTLPVEEVYAAVACLLDRSTRRPQPALAAATVRTERHTSRHSWQALFDAGYELPLVSIVLLASAFDPRKPGQTTERDRVAAALRELEQQDYPRLEVILVQPAGETGPSESYESLLPVRAIRLEASDAKTAWQTILNDARGDLVAPRFLDPPWGMKKIGADVSALMQDAWATILVWRHVGPRPYGKTHFLPGEVTFRREPVAEALATFEAANTADLRWLWRQLPKLGTATVIPGTASTARS